MFWKRRVYLDTGAGMTANPSSPHDEGREAKRVLEESRTKIARLLEVQADDVIFTSGATESNALAILGVVRASGKKNPHILYLPTAHTSIVRNVELLAKEGAVIEPLPIREYAVDTEALKGLIRDDTVLITMEAVCGETGVVWNTREVANVLREYNRRGSSLAPSGHRQPVASITASPVLHVDASQAPHSEKMTRAHFGADLITLDSSKVSRARGVGALVAPRTIPVSPLYAGGEQERGLRAGSEAPELVRVLAEGLKDAVEMREVFRERAVKDRGMLLTLIAPLIERYGHGIVIEGRDQAPHIVNLSLRGADTDYLVALLNEAGFAVATRSACETDSEEGSRAVFALTGDRERAKSTLRISWGPETSTRDLKRFGQALIKAVAFIDRGLKR